MVTRRDLRAERDFYSPMTGDKSSTYGSQVKNKLSNIKNVKSTRTKPIEAVFAKLLKTADPFTQIEEKKSYAPQEDNDIKGQIEGAVGAAQDAIGQGVSKVKEFAKSTGQRASERRAEQQLKRQEERAADKADFDRQLGDFKSEMGTQSSRLAENNRLLSGMRTDRDQYRKTQSDKIQNICNELEKLCGKPVSLLPTFHVHKNYHINLKEVHGWHRDAGGELFYDYCKKKLSQKSYLFSKVGIYLQNNTDFGGGIDIINKTHKNFTPLKTIIRKILNIPFRLITFLHKYVLNLYYVIPENFFMFLMNAKKIYSNKGSAIFFDSRLIHRGSPISKKKFKDVKFYKGEYKAKLPKEFDKYVIYLHFGNTEAVDSYMYYKFKTKGDIELKLWIKQINLISKYDTKLSKKMYSIISPIIAKYKDHLN